MTHNACINCFQFIECKVGTGEVSPLDTTQWKVRAWAWALYQQQVLGKEGRQQMKGTNEDLCSICPI